jgi:hypothetical protein
MWFVPPGSYVRSLVPLVAVLGGGMEPSRGGAYRKVIKSLRGDTQKDLDHMTRGEHTQEVWG